jgi:hypothetical protein
MSNIMNKIRLEGIAEELMSAILFEYHQSHKPVLVSGKYAPLVKYMEQNGFIVSTETDAGDILAAPVSTRK